MISPARSGWLHALSLGLVATGWPLAALGDDRPAKPVNPETRASDEAVQAIKPMPLTAIPDSPPPHEGAMIDQEMTIEPPDIIIVEVLEALAGRPIAGERLVRPDGTISLGFYGDIHVRGLTPTQAKVKIVHHLRRYLNDDILGLRVFHVEGSKVEPLPPPGTRINVELAVPQDNRPFEKPDVEPAVPPVVPAPNQPAEAKPTRASSARAARSSRAARVTFQARRGVGPDQKPAEPAQAPGEAMAQAAPSQVLAGEVVYIDPTETIRVFVDFAAHNSKIYHVLGDVGTPGRLPCTGKETVLDALNFAGGLIPTAEPTDIHLYRPARGDQPMRNYVVNYAAILQGVKEQNYQIFPDDRLIVGRNSVVVKAIEIDRALAPLNSILNSSLQHSFTLRALGSTAGDINGTTQAIRDRTFRKWFDILWNLPTGKAESLDASQLLESVPMKSEPLK